MTAEEYHADPCETPSLSSSIAKELILYSPFHAWMHHPRLGGVKREPSKAMHRGTVLHSLLLGFGLDDCVIIDAENYRTKAAQVKRDDAIEAGKTPFLVAEINEVLELVRELERECGDILQSLTAQREHVTMWQHMCSDLDGTLIQCRNMFDWVDIAAGAIIDIKTCSSAHTKNIKRQIVDLGYDIQFAAYTEAVRASNPAIAGRETFRWIFIEELPAGSPKRALVSICEPDAQLKEFGNRRWNRACDLWAQCLANDNWPSYADGVKKIGVSEWQFAEEFADVNSEVVSIMRGNRS